MPVGKDRRADWKGAKEKRAEAGAVSSSAHEEPGEAPVMEAEMEGREMEGKDFEFFLGGSL